MAHFDVTTRRLAVLTQFDGATGDLRGFVTDALQVDDRLGDADDQAQVGSRRLAAREDADALLIDVAFHVVDLVIYVAHLLREPGIGIDQRGDRIVDLLFHQATHGQEMAAHLFQLGVELLGDVLRVAVFADHLFAPRRLPLGGSGAQRT